MIDLSDLRFSAEEEDNALFFCLEERVEPIAARFGGNPALDEIFDTQVLPVVERRLAAAGLSLNPSQTVEMRRLFANLFVRGSYDFEDYRTELRFAVMPQGLSTPILARNGKNRICVAVRWYTDIGAIRSSFYVIGLRGTVKKVD